MLPLPHKRIPFLSLEWDPSFSKGMHEKRMFRGPGSGFQQLLMFSPYSQWDLKIIEILKDSITPATFIVSTSLRKKKKKKKQFRPFGWLHLDQTSNCLWTRHVLLFLFGTSVLFHVQFQLLLPDLHTGFTGGRSGGLVFPSLRIFHSLLWSTQWKALA